MCGLCTNHLSVAVLKHHGQGHIDYAEFIQAVVPEG